MNRRKSIFDPHDPHPWVVAELRRHATSLKLSEAEHQRSMRWTLILMKSQTDCAAEQEYLEILRQQRGDPLPLVPPNKRPQPNPQPVVYFIGTGQTVKIGYSTQPIDHRLRNLQCGNPENLKVLLVIPGTQQTEQELHKRFSPLRIRGKGEWFRAEGELLEFIQKRGEL